MSTADINGESNGISLQIGERTNSEESDWNTFFNDGTRRIDFVLVYYKNDTNEKNVTKRDIFEKNLITEGLQIEYEDRDHVSTRKPKTKCGSSVEPSPEPPVNGHEHEKHLRYVKIHAPFDLICRYAEALKLHMPMKTSIEALIQSGAVVRASHCRALLDGEATVDDSNGDQSRPQGEPCFNKFLRFFKLYPHMEDLARRCTIVFNRSRLYMFDMQKGESFFSQKDRIYIVNYILQRKSYTIVSDRAEKEGQHPDKDHQTKNLVNEFGIDRLIRNEVYLAAFPLHDSPNDNSTAGRYSTGMRQKLHQNWSSWHNLCKLQPLNCVFEYFGEAVAWYFAWISFYTGWLVPITLLGIIVFIYGLASAWNDPLTFAYCNANSSAIMCPLCFTGCPYWTMASQCANLVIVKVFSNEATFIWGCVMALWCTILLEFWKRRQYRLMYEWNLLGFQRDEEPPRPEYAELAESAMADEERGVKAKSRFRVHKNPITGKDEPFVPFWKVRAPRYVVSLFSVLFGLVLALACIVGVIIYRVAIQTVIDKTGDSFLTGYSSTIASVSGACANLLVIMFLSLVYTRVAQWLTDREYWRTQSEYNAALSVKLALLQFVNYFSSIFYIAFFKGQFGSVANYVENGNNTIVLDFRVESCTAGSCMAELCIQLIIIMIGKQLLNGILEILIPKMQVWYSDWRAKKSGLFNPKAKDALDGNYHLMELGPRPLFDEYLEMVLQYGFLSMFAIAFPLAPLFALLNNIFEIRIDARKFISDRRRPVPEQADNAIWNEVMTAISTIAILSNGALISFTSNVIPDMIYRGTTGGVVSFDSYTNFTLSYFDTSFYTRNGATANRTLLSTDNSHQYVMPAYCRYYDFRNPPWSQPPDQPYDLSKMFWNVLAWRFIVLVIFENVVMLVVYIIAVMIPDVPSAVKERQHRERYLTRQLLLKMNIQAAKRKTSVMKKLSSPVRRAANSFTMDAQAQEDANSLANEDLAMESGGF